MHCRLTVLKVAAITLLSWYYSYMRDYIPNRPNCYFAHPVTDYGTDREAAAVHVIESAGFSVTNPNTPEDQAAYKENGMAHFLGMIGVAKALAFQRFPEGQIGAGVGQEIAAAAEKYLPIYEIQNNNLYPIWPETVPALLQSTLSVDDTRALLAKLRTQS